jgi:hypothetical protein
MISRQATHRVQKIKCQNKTGLGIGIGIGIGGIKMVTFRAIFSDFSCTNLAN